MSNVKAKVSKDALPSLTRNKIGHFDSSRSVLEGNTRDWLEPFSFAQDPKRIEEKMVGLSYIGIFEVEAVLDEFDTKHSRTEKVC